MKLYSVISPLRCVPMTFCPDGPFSEGFDEHVNLCEPGYVVVEHLSRRSRDTFISKYRHWSGA